MLPVKERLVQASGREEVHAKLLMRALAGGSRRLGGVTATCLMMESPEGCVPSYGYGLSPPVANNQPGGPAGVGITAFAA